MRLADEAALVELSEMVRTYYLRVKDHRAAAIVSLLHVEHLYYKHDNIAIAVNRAHVFNKTWGKYSDLHPASQGKLAATIVEVRKGVMTVDAVHPGAFLGNPTVTVAPQGDQHQIRHDNYHCLLILTVTHPRNRITHILIIYYFH